MMEDAIAATVVRFAGLLVLHHADGLKTALAEALEVHRHLALDCSGAEAVDLAFVQLLLAARRSACMRGGSLILAAPAEGALRATLERGGFLDPALLASTLDPLFSIAGRPVPA